MREVMEKAKRLFSLILEKLGVPSTSRQPHASESPSAKRPTLIRHESASPSHSYKRHLCLNFDLGPLLAQLKDLHKRVVSDGINSEQIDPEWAVIHYHYLTKAQEWEALGKAMKAIQQEIGFLEKLCVQTSTGNEPEAVAQSQPGATSSKVVPPSTEAIQHASSASEATGSQPELPGQPELPEQESSGQPAQEANNGPSSPPKSTNHGASSVSGLARGRERMERSRAKRDVPLSEAGRKLKEAADRIREVSQKVETARRMTEMERTRQEIMGALRQSRENAAKRKAASRVSRQASGGTPK